MKVEIMAKTITYELNSEKLHMWRNFKNQILEAVLKNQKEWFIKHWAKVVWEFTIWKY
jgi:hypothetical protein